MHVIVEVFILVLLLSTGHVRAMFWIAMFCNGGAGHELLTDADLVLALRLCSDLAIFSKPRPGAPLSPNANEGKP